MMSSHVDKLRGGTRSIQCAFNHGVRQTDERVDSAISGQTRVDVQQRATVRRHDGIRNRFYHLRRPITYNFISRPTSSSHRSHHTVCSVSSRPAWRLKRLESVYHTHVSGEHIVDHSREISMPQHSLPHCDIFLLSSFNPKHNSQNRYGQYTEFSEKCNA